MKFFALAALIASTSAIRIEPSILEPGCHGGLAAAANSVTCPNNRDHVETAAATHTHAGISTDAGATAGIAFNQGPNGTVHVDGTFNPPAAPAAPPAPAAPVVTGGPNIHPGTTLTPYVAPVALSQIPANILEPGCIGGLAAAANSVTCPNNRAHVETAAATHGEAGIMTDKGAVANIALT
jgi:hypothetical protein